MKRRTLFGLTGCCALVVIGLILFGVLGLMQRDVGMDVVDTRVIKDQVSFGPDGIRVPISIDVVAYNDNFFDITLEDLQLDGTTPNYQGPLITGSIDRFLLPSRTKSIRKTIQLALVYSASRDPDGQFLRGIASTCANNSGASIPMTLTAKGFYSMYLRHHEPISIQKQESIPCEILKI